MAKVGRPLKEINWEVVEKRMEAGCTAREISSILRVDEDTFGRKFKVHYGKCFSELSGQFYSVGDANIRSMQYAKAMNGNINMLFFLGKERLGQGKEEVKVAPYEDILELKHDNMLLRAELAELKEKR
jgi:hypothetical protein